MISDSQSPRERFLALLDGHNKKLAPLIARTSLDFIESFTPPPDCDLPLEEARCLWPDKTILVHLPSSLHLLPQEQMLAQAALLLRQTGDGSRLAIGTSEDVPNRGIDTLAPLYRFLQMHNRLPLQTTWKTSS